MTENDLSETAASAYGLLQLDGESIQGTELKTRALRTHVPHGPLRVAIDALGHRHLLIPVGNGRVQADAKSVAVTFGERELAVDGRLGRFGDLACHDQDVDAAFEKLVDDVVGRLEEGGADPAAVSHQVLADWRALLAGKSGLGAQGIVGLVGELLVLELLASTDPIRAVETWVGPLKRTHDFITGARGLEVKATAMTDPVEISVSNLDQLDVGTLAELHLVLVHLAEDRSAPSIPERIDRVTTMGVPGPRVRDLVAASGWTPSSQHPDRYSTRTLRLWPIDENSPGLTRSRLDDRHLRGVSGVRYRLAVDALGPGLVSGVAANFLKKWLVQ